MFPSVAKHFHTRFACNRKLFHLLLLTAAITAVAENAHAAPVGSRFDPSDYTSIGALNLTSGQAITINTNTLSITGDFVGSGVTDSSQSGNVEMAIFNFSSINIASGVSITVTGDRGLVLGSQSGISLSSNIDVSGTNGVNNDTGASSAGQGGPGAEGGVPMFSFSSGPPSATAGKGGNGVNNTNGQDGVGFGGGIGGNNSGDGGSYGGIGGSSSSDFLYGDNLLTDLFGGSGGAGGGAGGGGGPGGGGGGAIELTAEEFIFLAAELLAEGGRGGNKTSPNPGTVRRGGGGGSGGGILLNAPEVEFALTASLNVSGGDGGFGRTSGNVSPANEGGGGGAGRIAIYANDLILPNGSLINDFLNLSGGAGGGPVGGGGSFQALEFGQVNVPEPASLALWLIIAFGTIGIAKRFRKTARLRT